MTTTHTNIALVEGEVIVLGKMASGKIGDTIYCTIDKKICKLLATYASYSCPILASTAKLDGVAQLDRKHFVKLKVDVTKKATEIFESSHLNLSTDFIIGYRFGYTDHAKEVEFTREDMENAISAARIIFKGGMPKYTTEEILSLILPLSLPKSVTLNENNEVIAVEW